MSVLSLLFRIAGVVCVIHGILILFFANMPEFIPGGWIANILTGVVLFSIGVVLFLSHRKKRVEK